MDNPRITAMPSLHFTIRSRLDELQTQCHEVCSKAEVGHEKTVFKSGATSVNEFFSNVQLWKERSLHRTLETLDQAGVTSTDSHMSAMENHERGAKDLFELTQVFLDRTWQQVNLQLTTFADDLVDLVDDIVQSRLEEQRLVHDNVVRSLEGEIQQLVQACHELKSINGDLEERLEMLENTAGKGGDAILCNKLRGRMQTLARRERELVTELQIAAQEGVKHRRELEKTKTQLADTQKSFALTRAMHDKETRQLAALLQLNHAQVTHVLEASRDATAKAAESRHHQPLERFDPLSGCTIVHLAPIPSPQKPPGSPSGNSPRRGSSPVLTTSKQPNTLPLNSQQRTDRPKSAGPKRISGTNSNSKPPSARAIRHSQV